MNNNMIELIGTVDKDYEYVYSAYGENFYELIVSVKRTSGNLDILKVICSDRIVNINKSIENKEVSISGSIRTRNIKNNDKVHLNVYVYAESVEILDIKNDYIGLNEVIINGYICKNSGLRDTPLKRQICDIIVATNRLNGTSDYIPCICWGKNAKYVSNLDIGTNIKITGRLQSREYMKNNIIKVAYELSCQTIELLDNIYN